MTKKALLAVPKLPESILEIGCGKGRFIINSAAAYPDINYIGIERALPYFRIMKERAAKKNLTNIRVLQDDAAYFIEKFVPEVDFQYATYG